MSRLLRPLVTAALSALASAGAQAQTMPGMTDQSQAAAHSSASAPYGPPMDDMASFSHLMLDQLEGRFGAGGDALRWSGEAWTGDDNNRLWLKSEGEVQNGRPEDARYEALYDRPLTSFWDLQAGARADIDSRPGRAWAALGVEGLAPFFVAVSATAYASDEGHLAFRLEGSDDIRITQRLILQPQIEINAYSRDDPDRVIGSGLSDLDGGLRLRYEITRKLAPYVGVVFERRFGRTADLAKAASEQADATRWVVGLRSWF
jgi:copper resistance protein B